jgi:low-affinity inorganic phosphate transporter
MGVSFVHGSNDGQKGIGLIMLVLIGLTPAQFVLNLDSSTYQIERTRDAAVHLRNFYNANESNLNGLVDFTKKEGEVVADSFKCNGKESLVVIDKKKGDLKNLRKDLTATTEYAPMWVIIAVALALGLGTMMGWKRIVYTVGEKIGKSGMTYSQGMAAQITAATAIGVASVTGMPVSTTHVLSSAVAGTMVANRTGLQFSTVRTILLAWVLTLPATILLSGGLFYLGTLFI